MRTYYTAPNLKIHLWGLGAVSSYWMAAVMFSFASLVFTTSYEMNPAWVSLAMVLPRVFDLVVDPLLGRISDNLHTPWGRRRPFILGTTLLGAFLVVGIWWLPLGWVDNWKGFTYLLTFSVLLYANFGAFDMAHISLGYELSDDYSQRSKVQAVRGLYFSIAGMGGGFTYWLAQRPLFGAGHAGEVHGFRCISLAMAAMILVCGLISVFTVNERFQNINRSHVPLLPAIKATLKNRAFVVVLIIRAVSSLGGTLGGSMLAYITIYCVCKGDKELYNAVVGGWNGIIGFVLGFALVPLAAPITRWLGKKRGIIICYGIMALASLAGPFLARPGFLYIGFIFGLCMSPVETVLGNLMGSVMPDICDVDELEHGERREGLFAAVMSFMGKLQSSIIGGMGGVLLVLSGFDQHLLQQPPEVIHKMKIYGFTPIILSAFLTFIAVCFFPLSRKKMDEIRAKLDARHAAAHIQGSDAG